ncbi:MAG: serine/threonine-protein kinase [Acidobacteriota bacterium]
MDELGTTTWSHVRRLFQRAVTMSETERAAYLEAACERPDVRAAVDSLLAHDVGSDLGLDDGDGDEALPVTSLERGVRRAAAEALAAGARPRVPDASWSGRRLGPYRLVRLLGVGGMGSVFLAERCDGEFEQRVAIKLVARGVADDELKSRFLVERQILAGLDHPHIARFLGGATTPEGLPYLVMEWIDGEPLLDFCRRRGLDLDARLALFDQVLDAVAYAHRHLIVHRDLKPANLLVVADDGRPDAVPVVKLLDFGIAKLLDGERDTALTRGRRGPMTPAYASPEQRLGEPVTTASDVYALGVVLYELLCERRPERPRVDDRLGLASEPLAPSRVAPPAIARRLRGDLERIVLRAMAVDPDRRYTSAAALADDLRRWRTHRPVAATPATPTYLAARFVRRHRAALAALALIVSALVWGVLAQHREAEAARRAEDETQAVVDFLVGLFEQSDPAATGAPPATLAEAVEIAAVRLERDAGRVPGLIGGSPSTFDRDGLAASAEVRARLQHALGRVYWNLGDFSRAARLLEGSLAHRRGVSGERGESTTADIAGTLFDLGKTYQLLGRDEDAERVLLRAIEMREGLDDRLGIASASTELSVLYRMQGRLDEAEAAVRRALDLFAEVGAPPDRRAAGLDHLAAVLSERGRTDEALAFGEEALALRRLAYGAAHPDIATSLNGLAIAQALAGRLDASRRLFEESLAMRQQILPGDHASLAQSHGNLGLLLLDMGDVAAARRHIEQALAIQSAAAEPNPRSLASTRALLARAQAALGEDAAAARNYEQAIAELDALPESERARLVAPLAGLAALRCAAGRIADGEALFRRALEIRRDKDLPGLPEVAALEAERAACASRAAPS